jgi:hypothetical protein
MPPSTRKSLALTLPFLGQEARPAPGRDQQAVVLDRCAIRDLDPVPLAIDAHRGEAESQVDSVREVMVRVTDEQSIAVESARQVFLRKRWALVGQQIFVANQRDRPGVATPAQRFDGLRGSLSGPDDDHPRIHWHVHPIHTV